VKTLHTGSFHASGYRIVATEYVSQHGVFWMYAIQRGDVAIYQSGAFWAENELVADALVVASEFRSREGED
jgi:hypothetical protein